MKLNQKIILILLFLGLIFSSMIRIRFSMENGYAFHEFWITPIPIPIFDYGAGSPAISHLTSTFLGYIFFLAAGIYLLLTAKRKLPELLITLVFLVLTIYALYYEGNTLFLDSQNGFKGQHMRIGPLLFILGLVVVLKNRIRATESN